MDRLQKKCVIASASMHGLLAGTLLFGSAFLSPSSKPSDREVLDFVPLKTIDEAFQGGGNPNVTQSPPAMRPQPQPQPPAPAPPPPKPEAVVKPEPVVPKAPAPQKLPDEPDITKPSAGKRLPVVSTTPVTRKADPRATTPKDDSDADARAQAKAAADARRQAQQAFSRAADRVGGVASSSTAVQLQGPGGGGVPYANFLDAVKSVYARAWIVPDGVTDDSATAIASVTIARDGTVVSSRITRASGNALVDTSVQAVLNRVRTAAPLPDSAKEDQRTVSIKFNVRAARSLG
jgi:TonB family protein